MILSRDLSVECDWLLFLPARENISVHISAKMASNLITVSFEGKRIGLMKEDLTLTELEMIFPVDPPGAHLKVKTSAGHQNIWPDRSGKFNVPPGCGSAILVAMHRQDEQESTFMPSSENPGGLSVGIRGARRGNSATAFFSPPCFNEHSSSVSSFQVMSRGRSKSFSSSRLQGGIGSRPAPALWGGKGKKRKAVETKSFRLTFVDGDGNFEDIWEISIDLSQLQESHGLYTVLHVVAEIERQLGEEDTKLVITDIKGNPIRDMPGTRGMFGFVIIRAQSSDANRKYY